MDKETLRCWRLTILQRYADECDAGPTRVTSRAVRPMCRLSRERTCYADARVAYQGSVRCRIGLRCGTGGYTHSCSTRRCWRSRVSPRWGHRTTTAMDIGGLGETAAARGSGA